MVFRLDRFLPKASLSFFARLLLSPLALFPCKHSKEASLRLSLERLGPIFIKFGQMLSTRKDLIDDDLADELCKLQDSVPPFSSKKAQSIIEAELGQSVHELFDNFDSKPLASASIAQVHTAQLKSGLDVVIKVVRPNILPIIQKDIKLLQLIAKLVERLHPDGYRLHAIEVVEDYQHTIIDELDLQKEAANTSQLRRNFLGSDSLYVPEVYWDYSTKNVFVMERIYGIPVTNIEELKAQGINMRKLAERGVEIFFTQVFRDSFFHADMHPGNVFVSRENPENPKYIGIDCAIIGSLSEFDQYYLARNLLAIFNRDYRAFAELHVECGWVPPHTRVAELESAIRSVCEPIFEKPLGEISFGHLLLGLFQTARRFDMEVQPSLVLLQKTLLNIEGLGRQLYPELDLWNTAKPFLEEWMRERYSPKSLLKQFQKQAPGWLEQLPQVPDLVLGRLHAPPTMHKASENFQHIDKSIVQLKWIALSSVVVSIAAVIVIFIKL